MEKFSVGMSAALTRVVSEGDVQLFAQITGDYNPIHFDADFAQGTRFKSPIAHGILSAGFISAVLGTKLPGPGGVYLSQSLKFLLPVRIGDTITAEVVVTHFDEARSRLRLNTRCFNLDGKDVLVGEAEILLDRMKEATREVEC